MKKYQWFLVFSLLISNFLVLIFIVRFLRQKGEASTVSKQEILGLLPEEVMLRDWVKIEKVKPETYFIIYIEPGYETIELDYLSCLGIILGQAIRGDYICALYQKGEIVDELKIPEAYSEIKNYDTMISYKNLKRNMYPQEKLSSSEAEEIEEVKLLDLKDYTGDNKAYEFLLTTSAGGCGFYDGLLVGYDEKENRLIIMSDWIERFRPDNNGEFDYLLECGDHGNDTRIERKYKFNPGIKKFEKVFEKKTPCN